MEVLIFLGVDQGAHHVGGQQVGGELYPAVLGFYELGKCLDRQCLCQARHALQQDVTVAEQSDEKRLNKMFLPHDDLVHSQGEVGDKRALLFYPHIEFADVK